MEVTQECASAQRPGFYCFQGYDRSLPEELIPPSTLPGFSQTLGLHGLPQPLPSVEMLTLTLQCHTSLSGEEQVGGMLFTLPRYRSFTMYPAASSPPVTSLQVQPGPTQSLGKGLQTRD